ncbi:MAG: isoprenyl transferase [Rhodospirillaceae bacterium]|nr:isoprenyl transferase [Rhodospirillaceae bacterium]
MQPQRAPLTSVDPAPPPGTPTHVAIIMDGNGRWAKARGLPRTAGHARGAEAVRRAIEGAVRLGIRYLTLFGFSSENWQRPESEVRDLMGLLQRYLRSEIDELHAEGVRVSVIGERTKFSADTIALIESAERRTAANTRLVLTLALSYGSRQEILAAAQALAADCASGKLKPHEIDEVALSRRLFTKDLPDPDLLIRTSGELRISNFLLWQSAYTELFFTETLWPDFSQADLEAAIASFRSRERRFGAVTG